MLPTILPCSTVKKTSAPVGNRRYYTDKSHVPKQLALKMDNWDNQAQRVKTVGRIPRIQHSTSWWGVMKRRARAGVSEPGCKVHNVIYDSINLLSNICLIEMIRHYAGPGFITEGSDWSWAVTNHS